MYNSNKMDVIEDSHGLSIKFSWFTPVAIFLIFFCAAWMGFLAFWYAMAIGSGGPWIMLVFPILHVAVGLGLSYYTLCLLFNKTYIDVDDRHLWIHHSPIPWWKGNIDLPVNEVEQIYVKEKKSRSKNGNTSYNYALMAKLNNGSTKSLLDINMTNSEKALELEQRIENYLGIKDRPVKGGYGKTVRKEPSPDIKFQRRINTDHHQLINHEVGDQFEFNGINYQVLHESQYDWKNGNSDKLLQLSDASNQNQLLYIRQNGGVFYNYFDQKLSLFQSNEIAFDL